MNRRNTLIALGVGVLCGGLAFLFLYQEAGEITKKATPVEVLFASRFIPARSFLSPDMAEKRSIPESYVSPSAIRETREVGGLMTLVNISAGEQVQSNKFGVGDESLALALNPGYRAYTLEVSEPNGVGGLIRPGNHVDILTKLDAGKREVTSFAFQNLPVLAVGRKLNSGPRSPKGQSGSGAEGDNGYTNITLAVSPEQAETLMYLEGKPLKVVLRASNDEEIVSVSTQSEAEVMSKLGHFTPQKSRNIEIIRSH